MHSLEFFLPKIVNGGGELTSLMLIREMSKDPEIAVGLHGQEVARDVHIEQVSCKDINFGNKLQLFWSVFIALKKSSKKSVTFVSVLSGMNIAVGITNLFFGRRLIAYEHSDLRTLYFSPATPIKSAIRVVLYNLALFRARKIIFVSEQSAARAQKFLLPHNKKKTSVLLNPIVNLHEKIRFSSEDTTLTFFLVGRNSPEKRLDSALHYLAKQSVEMKIILVTSKDFLVSKYENLESSITVYNDYSDLPPLNLENTFLVNFSLVKSYSLVIAEWLQIGGIALSTAEGISNDIWKQYKHFFHFEESLPLASQLELILRGAKKDTRPKFVGKSAVEFSRQFRELLDSLD